MLPLDSALPANLRALQKHLAATQDVFGDWQLARKAPLTRLYPDEEADLVAVAAAGFLPFAGSFSGGVLALDLDAPTIERAAVVEFDSEGGITVLGESFDDFLALLVSDDPDDAEHQMAEGEVREWILATGVTPHRSADARISELAPATRDTWIRWTTALHDASQRLRPQEIVDHRLVLGEGIGGIALGMPRAELDARWGAPTLPAWGRANSRVVALYPRAPFAIELDRATSTTAQITLFAGKHRARTADGVAPMFMLASEAMAWLDACGVAASRDRAAITAPSAMLRLSLDRAGSATTTEPWVSAIAIGLPAAYEPDDDDDDDDDTDDDDE
ncbi:MAG: SMI1/KNR4 family protein [Deltaproteobacteria bacterium]|nr:SMI1/KNR4 family protein [Deltaproteobacteria bacterium]